MATNQVSVTLEVRFRWWVHPYLNVLTWFCWTFGTYPDPDKVARVLERGVVIKAA